MCKTYTCQLTKIHRLKYQFVKKKCLDVKFLLISFLTLWWPPQQNTECQLKTRKEKNKGETINNIFK